MVLSGSVITLSGGIVGSGADVVSIGSNVTDSVEYGGDVSSASCEFTVLF